MKKADAIYTTAESPATTEDSVPYSMFDVSHMPLNQAIDAWKEAVGTANDVRFHTSPEQSLFTRKEAWHLGEVFISTLDSVSQEFKRSRYHIGLGGDDSYAVNFIEAGTLYIPAQDRLARPGDMIILDRSEPLTTHVKAQSPNATYHALGLFVPQRLLEPFLTLPKKKCAMVYDGHLPLVALLRQHLYAFKRQLPDMTFPQAQSIIQPTLELLTATMNGIVSETNASAFKNAMIQQIQRYIDAHITDLSLSANTIAATFQFSTRKLYQLFEPYGGVCAYIQRQRLGLIHAAIVDPVQRHRSIQDIAASHGFLHRKNFNTAFRRRYGLTPREARAYAIEGRSRNMYQASEEQDVWNWMLKLR